MSPSSTMIPTILVVDDSPLIQEMVKRALNQYYRVILTDNATDALSVISRQSISVLVSDVSMPDIDGLELCRTVRSLPQFHQLPIIMLTARDRTFDKIQGRLAGATEYLVKPFDPEQLHEVVKKYVSTFTNC